MYRRKNRCRPNGVCSNYQRHENSWKQKKGLSLTSEQKIKQDYVVQKQKHKN